MRVQWGAPSPYIATCNSRWFKTLSTLHNSVLVYRQHKHLASCQNRESQAETEQCQEFAITLDQSADRSRQSSRWQDGTTILAPCLLPRQVLWLHVPGDEERLLLGREALMIQGFPLCKVGKHADEVSERLLQDLAGNSMTLHVLLAVVQSAMAALPWKKNGSSAKSAAKEERDSAYALFSALR